MKTGEGFFDGVAGARIHHRCWSSGPVRAVLVLVHGLGEHGGRYRNLASDLVDDGYAVCGFDLPGHGRSDGRRLFVERFRVFSDTLAIYRRMIGRQYPDLPVFLLGHSMGGLITAVHLLDHPKDFAGAVLSSPSVKAPGTIPTATVIAGRMLSTLAPGLGLLRLDAESISRDPAVVRAYLEDPLVCTGKVSARLAAEILAAMKRVAEEAGRLRTPLFILQGSEDRLVDPAGARILYDAAGSEDKTIRIYDGLYHELFNEPERGEVIGNMAAWLRSRRKVAWPGRKPGGGDGA